MTIILRPEQEQCSWKPSTPVWRTPPMKHWTRLWTRCVYVCPGRPRLKRRPQRPLDGWRHSVSVMDSRWAGQRLRNCYLRAGREPYCSGCLDSLDMVLS